jgi:hypothetical protein
VLLAWWLRRNGSGGRDEPLCRRQMSVRRSVSGG